MVDICATAEAHSDIADDLLVIHRLSGANTIASLHGIGKATVIKVSKTGRFSLSKVGDVTADIKSVEAQATNFEKLECCGDPVVKQVRHQDAYRQTRLKLCATSRPAPFSDATFPSLTVCLDPLNSRDRE